MDSDLLLQGFELMLLGMGIVFGFLTILVFTLRAMSMLAARLDTSVPQQSGMPQPIDVSDNQPPIAVIAAAIAHYRASRSA